MAEMKRNDRNRINRNRRSWKRQYPVMPEAFHQALLREVERQTGMQMQETEAAPDLWMQEAKAQPGIWMREAGVIHTLSGAGRRRRRSAAKWIVIAAAAALCAMTALAAAGFGLSELFRFRAENIDALIQTEPEVTQPETTHIPAGMQENTDYMEWIDSRPALPDPSPLLEIRETLFDGIMLYIYAVPTDNGAQYDLNADRLYIDGAETGPVSTAQYYPGDVLDSGETVEGELYTFEVDLSGLELEDTFEVSLPLSVYEKTGIRTDQSMTAEEMENWTPPVRYQNQDLTFWVNAEATVQHGPDQSFAETDFTLDVTELSVSATRIVATFYYHLGGELQRACQSGEKLVLPPVFVSSEGTVCAQLVNSTEEMEEDGIQYTVSYVNTGISPEDEWCKIETRIRDYSTGEEYEVAAEHELKLK